MCGPQFELGVARRAQLDQVLAPAVHDIDAADDLRMAAIEILDQPQNRRQYADDGAQLRPERAVFFVDFLRRYLAVVARDKRDHFGLVRFEPAKIAVAD